MKKLAILFLFVASFAGQAAESIVKSKGALPQQTAVGSCTGLPTCEKADDGQGYKKYPCCIRTNLPGTGGTQM